MYAMVVENIQQRKGNTYHFQLATCL